MARIPEYIQFNELGVEPWSFIGMYAVTEDITSSDSIHRIGTPIIHIAVKPIVDSTIIHYLYTPIIQLTFSFVVDKSVHKLLTPTINDLRNSFVFNSIHRQGLYEGLNAPVKWACGRYLNTPYVSRYLETPCKQY